MSTTTTIAPLPSLKGTEVGTSASVEVTQEQVNLFDGADLQGSRCAPTGSGLTTRSAARAVLLGTRAA